MPCLTNVKLNAPLTEFYGFFKVTFAGKACPVIYRFDKSRTCTNDPNSTANSDIKCLFFVIVYPCIPVAGFDTIFDWCFSMLGRFFCLHIAQSTSCSQSCRRLGFLAFILTSTPHFYVLMCSHLVALWNSIVKVTFSHFITRQY